MTDGAAQSAIQYFENMRNFLVAVGEMKLLTFEASDLEKVWLILCMIPWNRKIEGNRKAIFTVGLKNAYNV